MAEWGLLLLTPVVSWCLPGCFSSSSSTRRRLESDALAQWNELWEPRLALCGEAFSTMSSSG